MINNICAAALAFLGFSTSLLVGLCVGNSFVTVVSRALIVMAAFFILGRVLAALGTKVIQENFDKMTAELATEEEDETPPEQNDNEDTTTDTDTEQATRQAMPTAQPG